MKCCIAALSVWIGLTATCLAGPLNPGVRTARPIDRDNGSVYPQEFTLFMSVLPCSSPTVEKNRLRHLRLLPVQCRPVVPDAAHANAIPLRLQEVGSMAGTSKPALNDY